MKQQIGFLRAQKQLVLQEKETLSSAIAEQRNLFERNVGRLQFLEREFRSVEDKSCTLEDLICRMTEFKEKFADELRAKKQGESFIRL